MESYKAYVEVQCNRNPCLLNLREFLSSARTSDRPCRIATLEFYQGVPKPVQRCVDSNILQAMLIPDEETGHLFGNRTQVHTSSPPDGSSNVSVPKVLGQSRNDSKGQDGSAIRTGEIMVIEDLTPQIIETLGSAFDIDPLFFANHIHSPSRRATSLTPDLATLPSRTRLDTYMNTLYHRGIVFEDSPHLDRKLRQVMNVGRRIAVMPLENDKSIGLVQHSASVFKATFPNNYWIGNYK